MQAAQAADYTNSIGMKFQNIPAGSFYMGSCKLSDEDKRANEKRVYMGLPVKRAHCLSGGSTDNYASSDEFPQHKVHISKSFQMGVYEVTLGQFKKFIAGAGRDDLLHSDFMRSNSHGQNAAVVYVSWEDAQDFISWLNKKEGGNHYRLPSEAEWEYAARAGTTTIYSWGDNFYRAGPYAWYTKNAWDYFSRPPKKGWGYYDRFAHEVGRKQPNPWGLYDMHGNAWEWVQDRYDKNYYHNSPAIDPKGPSWEGSNRKGVVRGGSWFDHALEMRSANRREEYPDLYCPSSGDRVGFRLLRQP